MIHGNTPLAHHLLELPIRNRIRYVPPHAPQDNFPLKLTTLEVDHAASPPPHDQWRSIAESPSCENLRQNRMLSFALDIQFAPKPFSLPLLFLHQFEERVMRVYDADACTLAMLH